MFCFQVRKKISDYLDDRLTEKDKIKFIQHINRCKICYNELIRYKETINKLKNIKKYEAPTYLWPRISRSLLRDEEDVATAFKYGKRRLIPRLTLALIITILLIFITSVSIHFYSSYKETKLEEAQKINEFLSQTIEFQQQLAKGESSAKREYLPQYDLFLEKEEKDELTQFLVGNNATDSHRLYETF